MFYTEWVTKDYLLVNISMLRLENLDEWILKQMPEVEHLEFYCNFWIYENMLPPNRGQTDCWNRFHCKYENISLEETSKIQEKMRKQIPLKPTIVFVQIGKR